jgi:hypothetical protein
VTLRGRVVAQISPPASATFKEKIAATVQELIDFLRIKGISGDTVLEWIHEGRKY